MTECKGESGPCFLLIIALVILGFISAFATVTTNDKLDSILELLKETSEAEK